MAKYLDLVGLSIFFGKLKPLYLSDISYANDKLTLTKGDGSTVSISLAPSITVDDTLSSSSTNAIQNKAVYSALLDKLDKDEQAFSALRATQDKAGNVITDTYAKKTDLSSYVKTINNTAPDDSGNVTIAIETITVDDTLSTTSVNPIQNKVVTSTFIKDISVSGSTLTFTKGDDTTGTATVAADAPVITTDTLQGWWDAA